MPGPAYRIRTPRLVIRCPHPADAPLLADAVAESLDHLRPWMPWVRFEPQALESRVQWLRVRRAAFDTDQEYAYLILTPDEGEVMGGIGLHRSVGEGALELGYWVGVRHAGRGYATEATAALTRAAFEIGGVQRMEIRCGPANERSAAIPRKLGYTLDGRLRASVPGVDGSMRDTLVWSLLRGEYPASPSASAAMEVWDAAGRQLL